MFDLEWILNQDERFRYQLLERMGMDCRYYLGYPLGIKTFSFFFKTGLIGGIGRAI